MIQTVCLVVSQVCSWCLPTQVFTQHLAKSRRWTNSPSRFEDRSADAGELNCGFGGHLSDKTCAGAQFSCSKFGETKYMMDLNVSCWIASHQGTSTNLMVLQQGTRPEPSWTIVFDPLRWPSPQLRQRKRRWMVDQQKYSLWWGYVIQQEWFLWRFVSTGGGSHL